MEPIINNKLRWDGSFLGTYPLSAVLVRWTLEDSTYYGIQLKEGILYTIAHRNKNILPCIVDELRPIFGLDRRGLHRIILGHDEYIIYYVPISGNNELIWETSLNRLNNKHHIKRDPEFRKSVQKVLAFCDLLLLMNTAETKIKLRPEKNGGLTPINFNDITNSVQRGNSYSVIPGPLYNKWFGEETTIPDIILEMIGETHQSKQDNVGFITTDFTNKVQNVVTKYGDEYIWYVNFVIERLSKHLLT